MIQGITHKKKTFRTNKLIKECCKIQYKVNKQKSVGFPGNTVVKNLPANAGGTRDGEFYVWVRKSRKWQPTLVFVPGKSMDRGAC